MCPVHLPRPAAARPTTALQGDTAARIKRLRSGAGLTQEQLAARLLVTPLTVHRWEAGHSKPRRLALDRLRQLEEEVSTAQAAAASADAPWSGDSPLRGPDGPGAAQPLDFNGDPDAVSAVAEALRLEYGHQFNPAFASEISRIDPLPHQRIAVYEHMLPQDPLRFLLADDAGAGKTIMTGLVVRDMLSRGRIRRVLISPPAGLVGNWERELRSLFRLPFRILSGPDVTAATRTGAGRQPGSPFQGRAGDLAIVSIDTLAGEGVFGALRDPEVEPYDLIVFDEAHKLAAFHRQPAHAQDMAVPAGGGAGRLPVPARQVLGPRLVCPPSVAAHGHAPHGQGLALPSSVAAAGPPRLRDRRSVPALPATRAGPPLPPANQRGDARPGGPPALPQALLRHLQLRARARPRRRAGPLRRHDRLPPPRLRPSDGRRRGPLGDGRLSTAVGQLVVGAAALVRATGGQAGGDGRGPAIRRARPLRREPQPTTPRPPVPDRLLRRPRRRRRRGGRRLGLDGARRSRRRPRTSKRPC